MDHIQRKLASIPVKTWLWLVIGLGLLARLGAVTRYPTTPWRRAFSTGMVLPSPPSGGR
jgi:hypothetical protein